MAPFAHACTRLQQPAECERMHATSIYACVRVASNVHCVGQGSFIHGHAGLQTSDDDCRHEHEYLHHFARAWLENTGSAFHGQHAVQMHSHVARIVLCLCRHIEHRTNMKHNISMYPRHAVRISRDGYDLKPCMPNHRITHTV